MDRREIALEGVDPSADLAGASPELGHVGAARVGARADRLLDPPGQLLAPAAQGVAFGEQRPPSAVQLDRPIDDGRVLALVDGSLAEPLRLVTEALQADAHGASSVLRAAVCTRTGPGPPSSGPQPATSRSRPTAKSSSSEASSQPARGPLVRPRRAR